MKWSVLTLLSAASFVYGQAAILPCKTATTVIYPPCPAILCIKPTTTTVTQTVTSTHSVTLPKTCPPLTVYPLPETMKKREAYPTTTAGPTPCLPLTTTLTYTKPCPTCTTLVTTTETTTVHKTKIVPRICPLA
ncbi:hypothetical protein PIIN_06900 [Serendipita indica DSM 11827]|uniref:Uncharacterized protein n=1 Tax=Serendipita indica (strain DSM 11827) TaxID=1109443 RepID=G4TNQ2_SERID|nr:hypothetical protein PIIN_06900 [Serendipita indica DSM 11827]